MVISVICFGELNKYPKICFLIDNNDYQLNSKFYLKVNITMSKICIIINQKMLVTPFFKKRGGNSNLIFSMLLIFLIRVPSFFNYILCFLIDFFISRVLEIIPIIKFIALGSYGYLFRDDKFPLLRLKFLV